MYLTKTPTYLGLRGAFRQDVAIPQVVDLDVLNEPVAHVVRSAEPFCCTTGPPQHSLWIADLASVGNVLLAG